MSARKELDALRRDIGEYLGVDPRGVGLFWKGRVAFYALLKALGIGPGDEVVLPAFTCVVVPNAVIYAGATPVFADIDSQTMTIDPGSVSRVLTHRTRVVMAQNTFGLPADFDALAEATAGSKAVILDDATHGLGSEYRGARLNSRVAGAFYSSQWSKPISSGLGGVAVTADPQLAAAIREIERAAARPGIVNRWSLRLLRTGYGVASRHLGTGQMRRFYHAVARAGIGVPSSGEDELDAPEMPDRYLQRMEAAEASVVREKLARLPGDVERRRRVAAAYDDMVVSLGRRPPQTPSYAHHGWLRYPLHVADRKGLTTAAVRAGIEVGDWFVSPLHPVTSHLERWQYRLGSCPIAERTAAHIVNLPTHSRVTRSTIEATASFLRQNVTLVGPDQDDAHRAPAGSGPPPDLA